MLTTSYYFNKKERRLEQTKSKKLPEHPSGLNKVRRPGRRAKACSGAGFSTRGDGGTDRIVCATESAFLIHQGGDDAHQIVLGQNFEVGFVHFNEHCVIFVAQDVSDAFVEV